MTAKEARHRDDGQDDPDNPIVPFRMSDRWTIVKLQWWLTALTFLIGTGMTLNRLVGR